MIEVPVIRYRSLPAECFDPVRIGELEDGATNEALARAYRDALADATLQAETLAGCRELEVAPVDDETEPR